MHILYGKTFSLLPSSRSSVKEKARYHGPLPYIDNPYKYQGHICLKKKWPLRGHSCFTNTFCLHSKVCKPLAAFHAVIVLTLYSVDTHFNTSTTQLLKTM